MEYLAKQSVLEANGCVWKWLVPHCTQWFSWSLSRHEKWLAIIGIILTQHFQTKPNMNFWYSQWDNIPKYDNIPYFQSIFPICNSWWLHLGIWSVQNGIHLGIQWHPGPHPGPRTMGTTSSALAKAFMLYLNAPQHTGTFTDRQMGDIMGNTLW